MRGSSRAPMVLLGFFLAAGISLPAQTGGSSDVCRSLRETADLTLLSARIQEVPGASLEYCYVTGIISPAIHYHVQLPLPGNWNGRFIQWGDGGKDGTLDFADHRVAQGYAVANSNTGHDSGSEPGASFGFDNRQSEIDFGYRSVNLTVKAAKTIIRHFYGHPPEYSYFEGCSTGGRQGLMEAQRFPHDFDGIVAGAPVHNYQALNISHVWMLQKLFLNDYAGNLAFDTDGDGGFDSLRKWEIVRDGVLEKCDADDGIRDGVVDDPLACDFDPVADLADWMCEGDVNRDGCLTSTQIETIQAIYAGARDSRGVPILKGIARGSEFGWPKFLIPHQGNAMRPGQLVHASTHANYLFYEEDPGVAVPDPSDLDYSPDKKGRLPEWAWWEFDIDDFTAGRGELMSSIMDATDPDLERFLIGNGGKLILYHGWGDAGSHPEPTLDYYNEVLEATFGGDLEKGKAHARLFMVPGMDHCRGGPGPDEWDRLAPMVEWVERGRPPDFIVARHRTNGRVDNERPICAYPQRAVYTGPAGSETDRSNWVASNFACQMPAER